ncbi:alpha/beta hydrolase [Demequina sp. SYSU T00039]|uniref:Alpha/beta hydrolase n=1 Tax=Demequina lignilytica TaxID=3051663 RepID=A0AAW7MAE3_9MICO|nr:MULTISPECIES: alpha/beta hydrolase [unclassified Demequina]MDN4478863.1 alpha/beta hydrolase [Demequina sp. SYSU T00039-1]MDN4488961.1 alpha/beta hydrolase [Demequina sp. SYSU T00039]
MRPRPVRDDARYRSAEAALWAHHGIPDPVERWVQVPSLGIRVRVVERGEGRPVVFVHGTPSAGANLVPLVAALPGVRAIVVDRPGCGLSDPIDYRDLTRDGLLAALEAYLAAVIESIDEAPVDLVGSSAGGMAVLHLASVRPDLARSIVLAGVPAVRGMRLPAQMKAAATAPIANAIPRHWTTEREVRASLRAVGHERLIAEGGVTGPDMEWRLALARHTDTFAHELRLLRRVATWRGLRSDWMIAQAGLEAIQAPSLWLVGDRDPYASPERVRGWAAHARGSTVVTLPGVGHLPWLDDAAGVGAMIARWWADAPVRMADVGGRI